jgi:hypothetical protein
MILKVPNFFEIVPDSIGSSASSSSSWLSISTSFNPKIISPSLILCFPDAGTTGSGYQRNHITATYSKDKILEGIKSSFAGVEKYIPDGNYQFNFRLTDNYKSSVDINSISYMSILVVYSSSFYANIKIIGGEITEVTSFSIDKTSSYNNDISTYRSIFIPTKLTFISSIS